MEQTLKQAHKDLVVRWSEVTHVNELVFTSFPWGFLVKVSYTLKTQGGVTCSVRGLDVPRIREFGQMLKKRLSQYNIAWRTETS